MNECQGWWTLTTSDGNRGGKGPVLYNCLQSYWTCLFHCLGMSSLLAFIDKEIFEMF